MLKPENIINCKFSQEYWKKAMNYACKSWPYTYNRMAKSKISERCENILIGLGFGEAAFINYLDSQKIKFNTKGKTRWYQEDLNDFIINSKNIDVKVMQINKKNKMHNGFFLKSILERKKHIINNCIFLIPEDQFRSKNTKDIYCCIVVTGKFNSLADKNLHFFLKEYIWMGTKDKPELKIKNNRNVKEKDCRLGKIYFILNQKEKIQIQIFGTKCEKVFTTEIIELGLEKKFSVNLYDDIYSLRIIKGNIQNDLLIGSEKLNEIQKNILKNDWESLYYEFEDIMIIGFATKDDIKSKSQIYPRFSKNTGFYPDTMTSNFGIRCKDLRSIKDLQNILSA
jgi:hypothetical protein